MRKGEFGCVGKFLILLVKKNIREDSLASKKKTVLCLKRMQKKDKNFVKTTLRKNAK